MRRFGISVLLLVAFVATVFAVAEGVRRFKGSLTGYEEVPAVSTVASGDFNAVVNDKDGTVQWELSYRDLEGAVQQSHIHFGQTGVNGGISVFLCTNLGNGPVGTQPCPPPPATISGTFSSGDVIGPAGQGIAPGEFDELVEAIRAGKTYANVHSTKWPGGEVRSQLGPGKSNHQH